MVTRRNVLRYGAAAGAAAVLRPWEITFARVDASALPQSTSGGGLYAAAGTPNIKPFTDALPTALAVLTPDTTKYPGVDYYEIMMKPGTWKFSTQFLGAAKTWGYWGTGVSAFGGKDVGVAGPDPLGGYLGPTIQAKKGTPVVVKYINALTGAHPVANSIDPTIGGNDNPPVPGSTYPVGRATPHLHGGFTPAQFDGHPYSWWTATGQHDPAVKNAANGGGSYFGTLTGGGGNSAIYWYSNQQPAAMLWYHDHAFGITRLNAYAGLAALYFIRDSQDTGQANNPLGLPAGPYEIPLVIQDKQFNADGTLFYPTTNGQVPPYPHPIWMPEFFGDTPVINATAYPFLNVEPRRYRFRMVNGSQARFYNISLSNNTPMYVIGMEQSLLPTTPAKVNALLLAPGERADVIIDFAGISKGANIQMKNNANTPYPGGGGRPGGPQINTLMQFNVNLPLVGTDTTKNPAIPGQLVLPPLADTNLIPTITTGTTRRQIIMKEFFLPGNKFPVEVKLNERHFDDKVNGQFIFDETPPKGGTEVWEFVNCTVDAHPMHMHLVKFQIVGRYTFNAALYFTDYQAWIAAGRVPAQKPDPSTATYTPGPVTAPAPEETGWKDTAKAYPGQVLRVVAKFDLPTPGMAGTENPSKPEYVFHCHILEHEENDMMRAFVVDGTPTLAAAPAAMPAVGAGTQPTSTTNGAPAPAPSPRTATGPATSGVGTGPTPAPIPTSR